MRSITITLNDEEQALLTEEYKKMSIDWLRCRPGTLPPAFEQWVTDRTIASIRESALRGTESEEIRAIDAIEKLITGLRPNGFGLVHFGKAGIEPADSAEELADKMATELGLSRTRANRIRELLVNYAKHPKEIADAGHVVVTRRTYGALHEAYRELVLRTEKARKRLGEDKALGRVEGGVAILVSLNVMTRETAQAKTDAFKLQQDSIG
ncbi:hypothetical protein [Noviherbaspirillum sp. Root189]|uniref:hypothetical protein n=1 Tax=Noviherbaspirillum sp. Root189 TaxID=1736487 RepID=UPI00070B995B|nr:hypothetical protein [Noviherbaspirillum sp. Root189]KRB87574.1 hypothetical protein ASE07_19510 [Noviherbaspirillum sp. Root189]